MTKGAVSTNGIIPPYPLRFIRIGNDINVVINISAKNDENYNLYRKRIRIWLVSGPYRIEIWNYKINLPRQIQFVIDRATIYRYGIYKFELYIKNPVTDVDEETFDIPNVFQIVSQNYIGGESGNINLEFGVVITDTGNGFKLYDTTGQNTDGAMTQKAVTDELNGIVNWDTELETEVDLRVKGETKRLLKTEAIEYADKRVNLVEGDELVALMRVMGIYMGI